MRAGLLGSLLLLWASGQAQEPVCVESAGLEPSALTAALALEGRKWGAAPPSLALVGCATLSPSGLTWRLRLPDGRLVSLPLADVPAEERAPVLARMLWEAFNPPPLEALPLAELASTPSPEHPLSLGAVAGYEGLGGARAWLGAESYLGVWQGFSLGARAAWSPSLEVAAGAGEGELSRLEALGLFRGSWPLGGPQGVLSLGMGAEWRTLEVQDALRFEPVADRSQALVLLLEPGIKWSWGERVQFGVAGAVRQYLGGEDYRWQGISLWSAPRRTAGLVLQVGVKL